MSFELSSGKCLLIAEVAQAHDGSLGMAHAYIDASAQAGADAVKFQTHIAAAESSPDEPWRVRFSYQDDTRFEYWRRMEFTEAQWAGLAKHATDRGLLFLSSPFSVEAAQMLHRIGMPAWKVASGEINNSLLFDFLLSTRIPILLSTGMSSVDEVDRAISQIQGKGIAAVVMQCTSKYPCPPEQVGLNMLSYFRERYGAAVGLSDHSGTIYPSLASAALGADVVEVHVTLSREAFGPDVSASVTTTELRQIADGLRFIGAMRGTAVNKDAAAKEMVGMRKLFTKSLVAEADLPVGTVIARRHLGLRKPGTGIPVDQIDEIIGRRLARLVPANKFLSEDDFLPQEAVVESR